MIERLVVAVLLALIAAIAAVVLVSGVHQDAANASRSVIGARQEWCSADGRWVSHAHTGWLPTVNCSFPPPALELEAR